MRFRLSNCNRICTQHRESAQASWHSREAQHRRCAQALWHSCDRECARASWHSCEAQRRKCAQASRHSCEASSAAPPLAVPPLADQCPVSCGGGPEKGAEHVQRGWCSEGVKMAGKKVGSVIGGRDARGERSQERRRWERRGREGEEGEGGSAEARETSGEMCRG